ncbi:MAG: DUF4432 family protein, partial [Nitrososphaerales archaeon]
ISHSTSVIPLECTVSDDWNFRGIATVIFENRNLRLVVLSGKGTDISEITFKSLDLNLLYRNPWGPKSPKQVPVVSPHNEIFRDYTGGGWSDIIPNAGVSCEFLGTKFGLHDETPLLEWSHKILEDKGKEVSVKFWTNLKKYPFHVEKTMMLNDSNELKITEAITNNGRHDLPFSWLVHPTFSSKFLDGDSTLNIPCTRIQHLSEIENHEKKSWAYPFFVDVDGSSKDVRKLPFSDTSILDDTLILSGLDTGHYDLANPKLGIRFSLEWDDKIFPNVWYYRSINSQNYPYFGRSQFIAVEPCTSMHSGLANQVRYGDARVLQGGESLSTELTMSVARF